VGRPWRPVNHFPDVWSCEIGLFNTPHWALFPVSAGQSQSALAWCHAALCMPVGCTLNNVYVYWLSNAPFVTPHSWPVIGNQHPCPLGHAGIKGRSRGCHRGRFITSLTYGHVTMASSTPPFEPFSCYQQGCPGLLSCCTLHASGLHFE